MRKAIPWASEHFVQPDPVRGDAIASIIENYEILKQLWLEIKLEPDIKGRIIGVKA